MPRFIVHGRHPLVQSDAVGAKTDGAQKSDDFGTKLAKYVPAEILAVFVPMVTLVQGRKGLLLAALALGLLLTPAYLYTHARKAAPEQRPSPYSYVLATVAFVVWSLSMDDVRRLLNVDMVVASFALGTTVWILPLVDGLLETSRLGRR
jgi:hypothetical protein